MNIRAFFFDAGHRLFAVHHLPDEDARVKGHVLCISGFNEENNRCRSMLTLQAEAFARAGYGTLVVDLHGTGDSDGEYGDARWSVWLEDVEHAARWLQRQPGGCAGFLAVRLGAILASECHARMHLADAPLMLWQPVTDGKIHLTQFLRVRIASKLDRPGATKETTASMREQLAAGQSVEVGGYEIHPELAAAIDSAKLARHRPAPGSKVLWLDKSESAETGPAPASEAVIQAWRDTGTHLRFGQFQGPAFWQLHERVVNPSIIEQTTAWFTTRDN